MIPSSTTGNVHQYLNAEYLAPLTTTMDAKKSPLALLAQTCSQIGSDSSNKPVSSTSDQKQRSRHNSQRDKYSPGAVSVAGNVSISSSVSNCDTNRVSPFREVSRRNKGESNVKDGNSNTATSRHSILTSTTSSYTSRQPTSPSTKTSKKCVTLKVPTPSSTSEKHSLRHESHCAPKPGSLPLFGIPTTTHIDTSSASQVSYVGANPIQSQMITLSPGTIMNPYPLYGVNKPHTSGEALIPLYRDPFCVGCRLGTHMPHPMPVSGGESCGPNCNQCEKHNAVLAAAVSNLGSQFAVSALLAHALPFICNWVVGDGQCGRRFANSEELLQHLTSHMSVSVASPTAVVTGPTQPTGHAPAILPILSPSHTLLAPVQTQLRGYPTPPISPLGSRFHPYSKPQGSSTQPPTHAMSVTPFIPFSPYIYVPRPSSLHH